MEIDKNRVIEEIFSNLIDKSVKTVPIKNQEFLHNDTFENIFTNIILKKAKETGYYK